MEVVIHDHGRRAHMCREPLQRFEMRTNWKPGDKSVYRSQVKIVEVDEETILDLPASIFRMRPCYRAYPHWQ